MTDQQLIMSPLGDVQFAALKNKVRKNMSDTEPSVYAIRVNFSDSNFKDLISEINPRILGTNNATNKGDYTVQATSTFQPKVFAPDGTLLEGDEIPFYTKESSGTATIAVKPYTGKMGSGIRLVAVHFHTLDIVEGENNNSEENRAASLERLQAALAAAKTG